MWAKLVGPVGDSPKMAVKRKCPPPPSQKNSGLGIVILPWMIWTKRPVIRSTGAVFSLSFRAELCFFFRSGGSSTAGSHALPSLLPMLLGWTFGEVWLCFHPSGGTWMGAKKLTVGQTSTDFYWLVGWLVGWLVVSRKFSSKKARNKVTIRALDDFPQTYEFKIRWSFLVFESIGCFPN